MTMALFIMILVLIAMLVERSFKVALLNKMIADKDAELISYKSKNEEFSLSLSKMTNMDSHSSPLSVPPTQMTNHDGEIFNNQFSLLLRQSNKFSKLFATVLINVNHLNKVNEEYSNQTNDKILKESWLRLKQKLRDVDIVSLYRDNIFIALLPNMIKPEVIVHAVARIIQSFSEPFNIDNHSIEVSVNIGISIYPFDGDEREVLIAHAMDALKIAKANGNNIFQFYQEETQALGHRELRLKSIVKDANFVQNLTMEYVPYFNTQTKQIDCIEIVASLNTTEYGRIIFPQLARLSHYSSRVYELYEWMIESAIKKITEEDNPTFKQYSLLFKFDIKQFKTPNFAEDIIKIIKKFKNNDNKIIIELIDDGENTTTHNLDMYRQQILQINDAGIPLVVGIMALGHFALNKLNHIHFDALKVDEMLVRDLVKREESKLILERILLLVENLKAKILISGVDTIEQKQILEEMGCYVMQGKLFSEDVSVF